MQLTKKIKFSNELYKSVFKHLNFASIRFLCWLGVFYKVFSILEISEYALFGLIQSFANLSNIVITLNIRSSMQRVYGKSILAKYANQIYLAWIFFSCVIWGLITFLIYSIPFIANIAEIYFGQITIISIYCYIVSDVVFQSISSYLNAIRRISLFGLHAFSYQFLLLIALIYFKNYDLQKLIILMSICNMIGIFFIIPIKDLLKRKSRRYAKLKWSRKKIILSYILKYSRQTLFTKFMKSIFDFTSRSLLLPVGNGVALARVNFSLTIFHVFRLLEQVVFKAVTPIFLKTGGFTKYSYRALKKLIRAKSLIVLSFFLFSYLWKEVFFIIFPDKAINVFFEPLLILIAFQMVFSYWKNVYLIFCKTSILLLRNVFIYSTVSYGLGLLYILFFGINEITFGIVVAMIALINLLLIRYHRGGVRNSNYFMKMVR